MSSAISQIAAIVAGLALFTAGFIVFPVGHTISLAKSLTVSVSLAVFAAILIGVARNFGS